jgi:pimeloyl-ACP methyl ester carboxylesterase
LSGNSFLLIQILLTQKTASMTESVTIPHTTSATRTGPQQTRCCNIILIRGLLREHGHWGDFPERLAHYLPGYSIECADIPGNGEHNTRLSPASIPGITEALRVDYPTSRRRIIIAISMGGMIGLDWANRYPDEIEQLICINTSARPFSPFYQRLLPRNYLKILQALYTPSAQRERLIYRMVSSLPDNERVIADWISISRSRPIKTVNFFRQLWAAAWFRISSQPATKLLFFSSQQDALVHPDATQAIAHAWQIPCFIHPTAGHELPLDDPEWLCRHLATALLFPENEGVTTPD